MTKSTGHHNPKNKDEKKPRRSLIEIMAGHRISGTLLMVIVLIAGTLAYLQMNTQFFPSFQLKYIIISDIWPGASAKEVKKSITDPIEKELKGLNHVLRMQSTSTEGYAQILLELSQSADLTDMLEKTKDRVDAIQLPNNAEKVKVRRLTQFEPVTRVVLSGPTHDPSTLKVLALKVEKDLLSRGIDRVQLTGLPDQEISISLNANQLRRLNMTHQELANIIRNKSIDSPSGVVGADDLTYQVKGQGILTKVTEFQQLPVKFNQGNKLVSLNDIADVTLNPEEDQPTVFVNQRAAVDIFVSRLADSDSFKSADILNKYLDEMQTKLPPGYKLEKYYEFWKIIKDRLMLLLQNGVSGFILIFAILLLFLNARVATWVSVGIPISFAAAFVVLYLLGASINMIASLGFLMSIGIIVDDTIVVGEEAVKQYEDGKSPLQAAVLGAKRMLLPILASSLTTIAAFIPLLIIGGYIGEILIVIPIVVIAVILASLLECFLILPYHLRRSFKAMEVKKKNALRIAIEAMVHKVQYVAFRRLVKLAIEFRWVTISLTLVSILVTIALVLSGRPGFTFFPSPPGRDFFVDVTFNPGISNDQKKHYLKKVNHALKTTNDHYSINGEPLVKLAITFFNQQSPLVTGGITNAPRGRNYASMIVRAASPEKRKITNETFIKAWNERIPESPWVERVVINEPKAGPPGADLQIALVGSSPEKLKRAAEDLILALSKYDGVSDIFDNVPYGYQQLIFTLKPEAHTLGLTQADISQQLRGAITGITAHSFFEHNRETEVNIRLPNHEKNSASIIQRLRIKAPNGQLLPLHDLVDFSYARDFNMFRTLNGENSITISATVDAKANNVNRILSALTPIFNNLENTHNVNVSLAQQSRDETRMLNDMQTGMILGLCLIYIILAWVSASYYWPIFVMTSIPLGLVGAVWGHWIMGQNMTALSLFGLFGLAGIVVNSSIILLLRFKEIRDSGVPMREAIVEAACQRLRPVFLTTITTIGGLLPLLFETAFQAQFLIPIATSLCFGLMFSTVLILVLIPTLITMYEGMVEKRQARKLKAV